MERDLKRLPGVDLIFANVNAGNANFYVGLKALDERTLSQQDIMVKGSGLPSGLSEPARAAPRQGRFPRLASSRAAALGWPIELGFE